MLMPTPTRPLRNAMSIDVEDYFQVSAFAPYIRRDDWNGLECRVERNIDRILALLADKQVKATFFTLGWIAERYPQVVKAIVAGGHELASHGYGHERASDLNPAAFLDDIRPESVLGFAAGGRLHSATGPSRAVHPARARRDSKRAKTRKPRSSGR